MNKNIQGAYNTVVIFLHLIHCIVFIHMLIGILKVMEIYIDIDRCIVNYNIFTAFIFPRNQKNKVSNTLKIFI